jgi:hypothetical protein
MRTKADFNFYADRDINFEAGRNINIKAAGEMYTNVVKDNILIVEGNQNTHIFGNNSLKIDKDQKIIVSGNLDHTVSGNYKQTVGSNYDLNVGSSIKETAGASIDIKAGSDGKITTGAGFDLNAGGHNRQTSGGANETNAASIIETAGVIHMNGPSAATAATAADAVVAVEPIPPDFLFEHELPDLVKPSAIEPVETRVSILRRMPTFEPYPQHENLDPLFYKSSETDRDAEGRFANPSDAEKAPPTASMAEPAEEWKVYKKPADSPF